jgi:propanol-preferring alcohol dehydrogenase
VFRVLGHLALQYAQIFGGETIAVDITEEKLAPAKQLGAAHLINAATTDPVAAIEALGCGAGPVTPATPR